MARFDMQLPDEVMRDFRKIYDNSDAIFGKMVEAGADVVYNNIKASAPQGVKKSPMMNCLVKTRVYKTPSDGGINDKVGFYGYFINEKGKKTPAPLVVNMFEYGSNERNFPKHPFVRKSFKKAQIRKAMLQAQREASGGLLDE